MDRIKLDVRGLKETQAALRAKPKKMARTLKDMLEPGAKLLQKEAKRLVHVKTGKVKANIVIRTVKRTQNYVRLKVTMKGGEGGGAEGFPLEVGHVMSGKFAHFPGTVPPYPFMRPAFESKGKAAEQDAIRRLTTEVTKPWVQAPA